MMMYDPVSSAPRHPLENPRVRMMLGFILAGISGLFIGLFTASLPLPIYLLAVMQVALLTAWVLMRFPQWTTVLFWVAFAIQSTVLFGTILQGLYYPIYLMMIVNVVIALFSRRANLNWPILATYIALYGLFLLSLFNVYYSINFDLLQRLFIYIIGLLVFFQFTSEKHLWVLPRAQIWAGLIVSLWVIYQNFTIGAVRDHINADENYVTTIIVLGLLPIIAGQLSKQNGGGGLKRMAGWLLLAVGAYALLLLASRGITIAFLMAVFVMFARVLGDLRKSIPLMLLGIAAVVAIASLPGSETLVDRFTGADVASANGRTPLWSAGFQALMVASPLQLFLGHGLGFSTITAIPIMGFPFSIHNAFLEILLDVGVIGLFCFLLLHVFVFRAAWQWNDQLGLYAVAAIVFIFFANQSITFQNEFPFWVIMGHLLAIAAFLNLRSRNNAPEVPSTRNSQLN